MSWFHIELNNWLTIYIYIFATENLGNSNLGSLYSDFFFLHFFFVPANDPKNRFFSQLCHKYLQGKQKQDFKEKEEKKAVGGPGHGRVGEKGGVDAGAMRGAGAAGCPSPAVLLPS